MSDDYWRESREQRKKFRRSLEPCSRCQTKNPPEQRYCRRCGKVNLNYKGFAKEAK